MSSISQAFIIELIEWNRNRQEIEKLQKRNIKEKKKKKKKYRKEIEKKKKRN